MATMIIVALPFVLALGLPFVRARLSAAAQGWLLAAVMAALVGLALLQLPAVTAEGALLTSVEWVPQLGLSLTFYLDGLALLFVLVVTGMGTAIVLYAGYYFEDRREAGRFLAFLMVFTGSMLALVTAGNLLTLFIAWEGTSIASFLLIGFKGKDPAARAGALQALMVTGGGGLALLVGLLLLGSAAGSMDLAQVLASGETLRAHPYYAAIAVLVFVGSFTKSAQFPFHFWLPGAMSAPSPASAFLHSATMVKAGIYLLARLTPALGDTALWSNTLLVFGLATMLLGAVLALGKRDLKACLAFSTVSQLGALVALIGLPDAEGIKAAMVGILAHALYKGALFLVASAVDHATGTREIDRLGGLRVQMPGFALVTALSALSMAGMIPLFGFVAKELLLDAALHTADATAALIVIIVSAALTVTMALILFWDVFMGESRFATDHGADPAHDGAHVGEHDHTPHFHAPPRPLVYGPAGLALLSVLGGVGISPLVTPLVQPAVGKSIALYLLPPEGINTAFILSTLAIAAGVGLFVLRRVWLAWTFPALPSGPQVYQALVGAVEAFADLLLKSQNGRIRYYLLVILVAVSLLMSTAGLGALVDVSAITVTVRSAADVLKAVLLALALLATLASILFKRHLLAALALGVAGYSIGGVFLLEPAPDVALVQFVVETLATVLIIMILVRTSDEERARAMQNLWGGPRVGLWRDIALSAVVGVGVTLFALAAVNNRPNPQTVATWHLENALPATGVNDVVAAIVTDFRGMDTLVEITVFGIAALGVLTLLAPQTPGKRLPRLLRRGQPVPDTASTATATEEQALVDAPVLTLSFSNALNRFAARIVLAVALLISAAHILYAGAAPGDGFTAGVIAGLGVALWYVVFGYAETRARLRWLHPATFIGVGLALALLNAALPLLFDRAFFAFTLVPLELPAGIKLASTTAFEVGIFLTVFGGISAVMEAITHPKEVELL